MIGFPSSLSPRARGRENRERVERENSVKVLFPTCTKVKLLRLLYYFKQVKNAMPSWKETLSESIGFQMPCRYVDSFLHYKNMSVMLCMHGILTHFKVSSQQKFKKYSELTENNQSKSGLITKACF